MVSPARMQYARQRMHCAITLGTGRTAHDDSITCTSGGRAPASRGCSTFLGSGAFIHSTKDFVAGTVRKLQVRGIATGGHPMER